MTTYPPCTPALLRLNTDGAATKATPLPVPAATAPPWLPARFCVKFDPEMLTLFIVSTYSAPPSPAAVLAANDALRSGTRTWNK